MIQTAAASPAQNGLKKEKTKLSFWPNQSPDSNQVEMLWLDLKQTVHVQKLSSAIELKQFCKEEQVKIPDVKDSLPRVLKLFIWFWGAIIFPTQDQVRIAFFFLI